MEGGLGEYKRSPEIDKWHEEMKEKEKPFNFIKIDFLVDIREAESRYKSDYKNNVDNTRDCQLSFNQWLSNKKYEASKFYMEHSDCYFGF